MADTQRTPPGAAALTALPDVAAAHSPNGVKTLTLPGAIKPTGTWDLGARAGDFVYIAGMRGIDPRTNTLVPGDEARIRQGFRNMQMVAQSEGASLRDCVRIVVYVTDVIRLRPLVNKVQEELWGKGPYPPRTIVEVHRLNQDESRSKAPSMRQSKSNAVSIDWGCFIGGVNAPGNPLGSRTARFSAAGLPDIGEDE